MGIDKKAIAAVAYVRPAKVIPMAPEPKGNTGDVKYQARRTAATRRPVVVKMLPTMIERLDVLAAANNTTRSAVVTRILADYLRTK